jgi:hypothetical protein
MSPHSSIGCTAAWRAAELLLQPPAMKIIVALAFLLIIGSLASALLFMMRDKGKSNRTVYALTLRVGFSVLLFILLLLAYKFGLIQPTGIH